MFYGRKLMLEVSVTVLRNHVPDYCEKAGDGEGDAFSSRGREVTSVLLLGGGGAC